MTLQLIPTVRTLSAPPQIPLPALTWDWADGRLVAVSAWPESLTRRTPQVAEPGIQMPPLSTSLHRARIMDILDTQAATSSEALSALSAFCIKTFNACPSQLQLVNPVHPLRYENFRIALIDRVRSELNDFMAVRDHALFEMLQIESVETLPIYPEVQFAIINLNQVIAHVVAGRDDPAVWSQWAFDPDCRNTDKARAELDAVIDIPQDDLNALQPIARCIGRLSVFLDMSENRAWLEPKSGSDGKGSRGHQRWSEVSKRVEDARR